MLIPVLLLTYLLAFTTYYCSAGLALLDSLLFYKVSLSLSLLHQTTPQPQHSRLAMSGADGERGGTETICSTTAAFSSSFFPPSTSTWMADLSSSQFLPSSPSSSQELSLDSSFTPSDLSRPNDKLEFPIAASLARGGLPDSVFPDWKHGNPREGLEDPDEMQKKDPLATQIWKLYTRTKTQLPNQERMENLTWRMMAMSLRRKEREARYVLFALESYVQDASSCACYLSSLIFLLVVRTGPSCLSPLSLFFACASLPLFAALQPPRRVG